MQDDALTRWIRRLCVAVLAIAVLMVAVAAIWVVTRRIGTDQPEEHAAVNVSVDSTGLFKVYTGTLTSADGGQVPLTESGVPTLLLFWSSWCGDCEEYLRDGVEDAFAQAEALGARAWLVCRGGRRGENWDSAKKALIDHGVTRETLMDEGAVLFEAMGLRSVPSIVLLDGNGQLVLATTKMPDAAGVTAMLERVSRGAAAQTGAFVRAHLLTEEGGAAATYRVGAGGVAAESLALSETQGLVLEWALLRDDQALFDRTMNYIRSALTVNGLCAWQVENGTRGEVNASLDDLRIVAALLEAEERWGGYREEIAVREAALYNACVRGDGLLADYTVLEEGAPLGGVTLCYLDVAALTRLADYAERWQPVRDKAAELLQNGVISEEFPLYYPRYDPDSASYTGEQLQMNEAMVAVLNACRAGLAADATLDWLEERLREGPLYAVYTTAGEVVPGYQYESTASYALLAQAAMAAGRDELARLALGRLEQRRCYEAPLVGDYGQMSDGRHYTFDVMEALLCWEAAERR